MSNVQFDEPLDYQIIIKGAAGNDIYSLFKNARIGIVIEGEVVESIISIRVKDQSHLSGILNALYSNHYLILKVDSNESQISDPYMEVSQDDIDVA